MVLSYIYDIAIRVISMAIAEIRINARLTGEDAKRFRELQRKEGVSASDLLRDALREYHAARVKPRSNAKALLQRTGFLAGGEGPEDLSTRYKDYLVEALDDKLPARVSEPKSR